MFDKKFKNKVILVSSVGISSVAVASTTSVLLAYKDDLKQQTASTDVDDSSSLASPSTGDSSNLSVTPSSTVSQDTTVTVASSTSSNENRQGTMAASVMNEISSIYLDFQKTEANSYNVDQNYQEYSDNGNFSGYETTADDLKTDIFLYVYSLWISNSKNVDFTAVDVSGLNASSDNKILGSSQVSFNVEITISTFKSTTFSILGKSFDLPSNSTYNLIINVSNQTLMGTVNEYSSEYYLGWKVASATISFNNQSFQTEFTPTIDSYSYAFQYIFTDLTSKQNYVQLYNENQSKVLDMDVSEVKQQVENYYNQQYVDILDYIDYGIKILDSIRQNPDVKTLLEETVPYITEILVKANILPAFLTPLLDESFNSNKSCLEVCIDNKQAIIDWAEEYMPDLSSVIESIVDVISMDMTASQLNDIRGLLSYFGLGDSITTILMDDFFGATGNPKTLYDIIADNYEEIILLFKTSGNSSVISGITELFDLIFSLNSENSLTPIFTAIFDSTDSKEKFFNALGEIVNLNAVSSILDILVTNNGLINSTNIKAILDSLYNFTAQVFERKSDYSDFQTGYTNLTFSSKFLTTPSINKTNQTIDFSYDVSFTITKKIDLDLSPIIDLFDGSTIWSLLNSFQDLSGYSAFINKKWLCTAVMKYIPSTLSVGGSSSSTLSTTFTASNSNLYLNPILSGSDYDLGYKFDYTTTVSFQDPTLIDSITKNYKSSFNWSQLGFLVVWGDFYYSDFWRSIIQNMIVRDYVSTSRAEIQYSNEKIADTSTYDPSLYVTGFEVTPNKNSTLNIYEAVQNDSSNSIAPVTGPEISVATLTWSDGNQEIMLNETPVISDTVNDEIMSTYYTVSENSSYIDNTNLSYEYYSDAMLNFSLPIHIVVKYIIGKTDVNVSLNIFMMNFQLHLPFMYYDTVSGKMVDSYFNSFSYFDAPTTQKTSWFWQSSFYN